jgi:hypothetical protein
MRNPRNRGLSWHPIPKGLQLSKLFVTEFVSLNGVMEAPGGEQGHPHTGWTFKSHYED